MTEALFFRYTLQDKDSAVCLNQFKAAGFTQGNGALADFYQVFFFVAIARLQLEDSMHEAVSRVIILAYRQLPDV